MRGAATGAVAMGVVARAARYSEVEMPTLTDHNACWVCGISVSLSLLVPRRDENDAVLAWLCGECYNLARYNTLSKLERVVEFLETFGFDDDEDEVGQ